MSLIEDQQAARAVISHTNNITFHTGNIIDWFLMKKYKNSSISPDEVCFVCILFLLHILDLKYK